MLGPDTSLVGMEQTEDSTRRRSRSPQAATETQPGGGVGSFSALKPVAACCLVDHSRCARHVNARHFDQNAHTRCCTGRP